MNLLSANDFDQLENAMKQHQRIHLVRTLKKIRVEAKTLPAQPPWQVDMILQIRMEYGNVARVQNFDNVQDGKRRLDSWGESVHWYA